MHDRRFLALLALVFSWPTTARAQIITLEKVGDKTVACMHTGLSSDLRDCGVRAGWYTYVFLGSISSISPSANDEKKVQIHPEEVFHGDPPVPLTLFTSQAACLPKLAVGDRWLFYLRKENGKPIVLDYYGNDSLPVTDAKEQIETLRRLKTIGDLGIVRGYVWRREGTSGEPVGHARVVAHGETQNLHFITSTDTNGRYEFPPVPAGSYKITVDPIGPFRPEDASLDVIGGGCWDLTLTRYPHAQIGGYVRHSDGSPVASAQALLINVDTSVWATSHVDANGYFQFESLEAGTYVIGLRPTGAPSSDATSSGVPPPEPLYYPGVDNRLAAAAIALRTDEKRDNIDFSLPAR